MSVIDAIIRGDAVAVRQLLVSCVSTTRSAVTSDAPRLPVQSWAVTRAVTLAASRGHTGVIQTLCELLPPPHPPLADGQAPDYNDAFRAAAAKGNSALVRFLCGLPAAFGVEPGGYGNQAVLSAAKFGHEDVVRLLYELPPERGVHVAVQGSRVLGAAAWGGHIGIVRFLCELPPDRRVDPSAKGNYSVFIAAKEGHTEVVRYLCQALLERGLSTRGGLNWPLRGAAAAGRLDVVRYLCELPLSRGVDPAARGNEAVYSAAEGGHKEVVKYLCSLPLSRGVNPGADGLGLYNCALTAAAERGFLETVRFLCLLPRGRGVDPTTHGCNPVLGAASTGRDEIVSFMCRLGPAEGFPLDAKQLLLKTLTRSNKYTCVVRSLCSLPASVGVSTVQLRRTLHDLNDDSSAPATWRALVWHALLWRSRWPVLALRELRGRGHATAKACVLQPCTRTQCQARSRDAQQPARALKLPSMSRKRIRQ